MSFADNKGLRTAVLISGLLISISSILGTVYATVYGTRYNAKEIVRVEGKLDASHAQTEIVNKEIYSNLREARDHIIKDEIYNKMVDDNATAVKILSRDLGEIKGDVKVLLSRSN